MTYEIFATANGHRSTDPNDNPPYASRKANLIAAVESVGASVLMVQEYTPTMRADLPDYVWFARGNVAVGWLHGVWTVEHDNWYELTTGADDRWCVVVVLKHIKTGRELKIASTHLTNLEGPDGGDAWRLGQAKEIVDKIGGLDVLGGDFNDSGPVFDYLAGRGLLELAAQTDDFDGGNLATVHHYGPPKSGGRIDSILTRDDRKVKRAWIVRTDTQSKFPNATDHHLVAAQIQI